MISFIDSILPYVLSFVLTLLILGTMYNVFIWIVIKIPLILKEIFFRLMIKILKLDIVKKTIVKIALYMAKRKKRGFSNYNLLLKVESGLVN